MTHNHSGHEHGSRSEKGLRISLFIIGGIMVAEAVGGLAANSLALIGDAGHMLVDTLALGISLFALMLARRPATIKRTFGYHRAEIMAALLNGTILILVAIYIFYEAYQRFQDPPQVRSGLMLGVATVGLLANLTAMWLLRRERDVSLNIRGAFLHILGDTVSSVGVIIAGIIIAVTGWTYADPIVAMVIAVIILFGALQLLKESSDILLENVPRHIDMDEVVRFIKGVRGVEDIHDMHIWTITSGIHSLSTHVVIGDDMLSQTRRIIDEINNELEKKHSITHTTLQLECERCENCAEGFVCQITRPGHPIAEYHD